MSHDLVEQRCPVEDQQGMHLNNEKYTLQLSFNATVTYHTFYNTMALFFLSVAHVIDVPQTLVNIFKF